MRRLTSILVVFTLALTACATSGGGESSTTVTVGPTTTTAPAPVPTTSAPDPGATTTAAPDSATTTSDRLVAPDFTLELGNGGSYTLSEGDKPVYLVFWAEW